MKAILTWNDLLARLSIDQTATADTPTEITFNKANEHSHGVKVISDSRLTVDYPGVYVFEVMLQLNDDTQIHDVHFWLRKNNAGDSDGFDSKCSQCH